MGNNLIDQKLLDSVMTVAAAAAQEILAVYDTDFGVRRKEDHSPLTEADMAAHHCIVDGLGCLDPAWPVITEESAKLPFAERAQWRDYWLVDPLDGTREFVKRNGEFTVNIALISEHDPVLGVVLVPVTGDCYFAARGLGAFKREGAGKAQVIQVRKRPADHLVVAGSRSHGTPSTADFIQRLGRTELIAIGSSLKSCLVAEGRADVYPRFGPTSEWDTAAAQCIVEEAGGQLTDQALEPLRYNTKDSLLNPSFLAFGDAAEDWRKYM